MMEWSEDRIREQADWQAWKEGRALAGRGMAGPLKRRPGLLSGSFREGRTLVRTVVRLGDAMEVECSCPANRSTGGVCAHGVALALTSLRDGAPKPEAPATPTSEPITVVARSIIFPPDPAERLQQGYLTLRLETTDEEPAPADHRLSAWLAAQGAGDASMLTLDPGRLGSFLEAVSGHPRLQRQGGGRVEVLEDRVAPVRLADSERRAGLVALRLSGSGHRWFDWSGQLGVIGSHDDALVIGLLPIEAPSRDWLQRALELGARGSVRIPEAAFLGELDAWMDLVAPPAPGWLGQIHLQSTPPRVILELEGSLNALDAVAKLAYPGPAAFPLGGEGSDIDLPRIEEGDRVITRDQPFEIRAHGRLLRAGLEAGTDAGSYRLRDREAILSFIADHLSSMRRDWEVRIGERFQQQLGTVHVVRSHFDVPSESSLACEISFQTDAGKRVPAERIRGLLARGRRSATIANGANLVVAREVTDLTEPLLADLGFAGSEGRIQVNAAARILFQHLQKNTGQSLDISILRARKTVIPSERLQVSLRSYQQEGYQWLVSRIDDLKGVVLADEMGLGKTVQTIAYIAHLRAQGESRPLLVVVPTSLLGNWQEELERFAPKLRLVTLHGPKRDERRGRIPGADVVLTSYGTLARDLAFHLRGDYGLVVADEASLLRNPDSEISRAMARIPAARKLALSGTPIENRPLDLWAIFRFVAPGYLGGRKDFDERYAEASRDPQVARRLQLRASPFVLRRTKREVAKDLPEKIEIDEWLDLGEQARSIYAGLARTGLEQFEETRRQQGVSAARLHMLTLLLRLRQLCLDPVLLDPEADATSIKRERLTELLEERAEQRKKTLVFSQFRSFLRNFADSASEGLGRMFVLDGSTRNRGELVRAFQSEPGSAVFLISLKAGGYGLNLTAADMVVHMDPWWNPAAEAQASDRAHRIGQTEPVTVYRLLARDTIEERVRRLQAAKQGLIDAMQSDAAIPAGWTEADLRSLLS